MYCAEAPLRSRVEVPASRVSKLEKIGSVIYCYAKDTDEFLGQGSNEDELVEVLTRRLGPVTLHVQPEDGAEHLKISV
jgi:hypothetical protein